MSSTVVTRFAPSPTGYLHVGGARTALFSWLLARHCGGKFLLRIEDTDLARSTDQATRQLVEDLHWLGLNWDNPELVYQSKRLHVYNALIDELLARGLAYQAYETSGELDAQRKQAERARRQYRYRRPQLSDEQIRQYQSEGRPHVVRFVMPVKEYRFDDAVLGPGQGFGPGEVQDFIIRKSDGMPTFHFAVVVDDEEMGVTHVLRGQEHLLNTCNHIALQEALGYPRPVYAHLPVILNPQTSAKLSKRERDQRIRQRAGEIMRSSKRSIAQLAAEADLPEPRLAEWLGSDSKQLDLSEQPKVMRAVGLRGADLPEIMVHDFRKNGYLPEVLDNFLALLGWSPGGDKERMSIGEMIQLFTLDRVGQANAKFNREKLLAFNTEACAAASPVSLVPALRDYLSVNPDSPLSNATDEQLQKVLAMNTGMHILREADEKSRFFFIDDSAGSYSAEAVEKVLLKNDRQGANALAAMQPILAAVEPWTAAALENAVKSYCDATKLALGKVAQPIRVAISGVAVSPPIFQCLEFLGKERTMKRIARCLMQVGV